MKALSGGGDTRQMASANLSALRSAYEELARGNFRVLLPLLDPSVEWRWTPDQMGLTGDDVYCGIEDVSAAMAAWLRTWETFVVEAEEFAEDADEVSVRVRLRGRPRGSEAQLESRQFDVYSFRDGKIVRIENRPIQNPPTAESP